MVMKPQCPFSDIAAYTDYCLKCQKDFNKGTACMRSTRRKYFELWKSGVKLNLKERHLMMTCFDRWRVVKDATAESKIVVSGQDYMNWLEREVQRVESEHFTTRCVELEWRMPDGSKN